MNRHFFIICLLSIAILTFCFFYKSYGFLFFVKDHQVIKLVLKENFFAKSKKELLVEVVKTQESVAQGLSARHALTTASGQKIDGLLFILPEKRIHQFWMKDMLFNIDICWLNNLSFLSCEREVQAPITTRELTVYHSPGLSNLVLETTPNYLSDNELQAKLFFKWW